MRCEVSDVEGINSDMGMRVLVIDDEAPIRLLCRVNLEAEGMEVDEVGAQSGTKNKGKGRALEDDDSDSKEDAGQDSRKKKQKRSKGKGKSKKGFFNDL